MRFSIILSVLITMTMLSAISFAENKEEIDKVIVEDTSESFDMKSIPAKIRENMLNIKMCYRAELAKNKNTGSGKIKVNFTIGKSGKTKNINIKSSTLNNKNIEKCIMDIVSEIQFPQSPEGEIEVNYPFDFNK